MFNFNLKKGAVFGIDARIALVLISIASFAIAYNKQSINESKRLKEVTFNILEVEDALMAEYKKNYHDSVLFSTNYSSLSTAQKQEILGGKSHLFKDPWGNEWAIYAFLSDPGVYKALGEDIQPACFAIISAGPDGYDKVSRDYSAGVSDYDGCSMGDVLATYPADFSQQFDDLFYKFTTVGFEIELNKNVNERLDEIKTSLVAYARAEKLNRIDHCNSLPQASANIDSTCDLDSSGVYEQSELDNANYFPKSTLDLSGAVYANTATYNPTVATDMENMLYLIGLPKAYAYDNANRVLYYNSNDTAVTAPEYIASMYYKK